jgi:concanavalin A-like lectin/glucanase superfamily protein
MKRLSQLSTALLGAILCALSTATRQSQCINKFKLYPLPAQRPRMLTAACGLLVAVTVLPAHAQTCVQPPAGLVSWWPLDETSGTAVADVFGPNSGIATPPITTSGPPKSFPGFVGNGLNFFFGSRVNVAPNSSLDFATSKSFTIDGWIKGAAAPIVSNYNITTKIGYSVVFDGSKLRLEMGGSPPSTLWYGPPINPVASWTFVAVVIDRTTKKVTFYSGANGVLSAPFVSSPVIPAGANAGTNLPLAIGGCPGNPNGCNMIIDEVEIFDRALPQVDIKSIFDAGSAGKCKPTPRQGMTWRWGAVNATSGTVTVGCTDPVHPCNPYVGDQLCTDSLPLLCFKPFNPILPVPMSVIDTDFYHRWSGGIVATTAPVQASSFGGLLVNADAKCAQQFGPGWRVAEFHDGAKGAGGWNFQAYGNVGNQSSPFWVHINDQKNGTCWK